MSRTVERLRNTAGQAETLEERHGAPETHASRFGAVQPAPPIRHTEIPQLEKQPSVSLARNRYPSQSGKPMEKREQSLLQPRDLGGPGRRGGPPTVQGRSDALHRTWAVKPTGQLGPSCGDHNLTIAHRKAVRLQKSGEAPPARLA